MMAYFNGMYGSGFGFQNGAPLQAPAPQQSQTTGITWVQGLEGAKSYILPAGSTAVLMDSEQSRFYIKSVDQAGMPAPIRAFTFEEILDKPQVNPGVEYVTRDEFDKLVAKLESLTTKKKGAKDE